MLTCWSNPPREDTVTLELAVELVVRLRGVVADNVNSGGNEVANLNVAVALCLVVFEVPRLLRCRFPQRWNCRIASHDLRRS
jgi:hypothetical protein